MPTNRYIFLRPLVRIVIFCGAMSLVACSFGEVSLPDKATNIAKYIQAAKQGDAKAQFNLGLSYDRGEGVEKNYETAVEWYRKAAEQGYAKAQTNLGLSYDLGEGVERSFTERDELVVRRNHECHEEQTNDDDDNEGDDHLRIIGLTVP